MNDAQRKKAAALLQETNKFFDARFGAVDLDDETRRKLAAVGMDNALEDWTKTWVPPEGAAGAAGAAGAVGRAGASAGADLLVETKHDPSAKQASRLSNGFFDAVSSNHSATASASSGSKSSSSTSFRAGFGPPMPGLQSTEIKPSNSDVPDYLKIATGTATARRSSALQRGMPRANTTKPSGQGKTDSGPPPKVEDLRKGFEQLLSKPPPTFDALSSSGGSDARRLRQAQSEMRRKSSQGRIGMDSNAAGRRSRDRRAHEEGRGSGASKYGGASPPRAGHRGPESGFDYEKLKEAQRYASHFELRVNEDALSGCAGVGGIMTSSKGAGGSSRRGAKKTGKRSGGPNCDSHIRGAYRRQGGGKPRTRKRWGGEELARVVKETEPHFLRRECDRADRRTIPRQSMSMSSPEIFKRAQS